MIASIINLFRKRQTKNVLLSIGVETTNENRDRLTNSMNKFYSDHSEIMMQSIVVSPTEDPHKWNVFVPLTIDSNDSTDRWAATLTEFLTDEGFKV